MERATQAHLRPRRPHSTLIELSTLHWEPIHLLPCSEVELTFVKCSWARTDVIDAGCPDEVRRRGLNTIMPIKLILWDFGDTLADERWMLAPMAGAPDWPRLYSERVGSTALGQLWNTGAISTDEVAAELASVLEVEIDAVIAHMLACSRQVRFFSKVIAFVEECVAPQAIVTVNPDIFTKILVPEYQLDRLVNLIVTSWEQGTDDKTTLCECAIAQLGVTVPRTECLLVDNQVDNVLAWESKGGAAYYFRGENLFCEDFAEWINS
jgi:FMN phosphatase YigB (HAD superfamily)